MEMQEPSEEMILQHKKERKDLQGKSILKLGLGLHINQPALILGSLAHGLPLLFKSRYLCIKVHSCSLIQAQC